MGMIITKPIGRRNITQNTFPALANIKPMDRVRCQLRALNEKDAARLINLEPPAIYRIWKRDFETGLRLALAIDQQLATTENDNLVPDHRHVAQISRRERQYRKDRKRHMRKSNATG